MLPMSNAELDIALRERWEAVYQNLHEILMLHNAYLPFSARDMFLAENTLPEGYTIDEANLQVKDAGGNPDPTLSATLYRCALRKSAMAAAQALQRMLTNGDISGLRSDHNFFVRQFIRWKYRFFG